MADSLDQFEEKLRSLENRFTELEKLNDYLAQEAKIYQSLFEISQRLHSHSNLKDIFTELDRILLESFNVNEYAVILKNSDSSLLTIAHSAGLPKRALREIFYRPAEGLVGRVFSSKKVVYIPNAKVLRGLKYYNMTKPIQGSLFYLPLLGEQGTCIGVLKMRKFVKEGFNEINRRTLAKLQHFLGTTILNSYKFQFFATSGFFDESTRLYNSNYLEHQFPREFKRAQRYQHDLSIIFLTLTATRPAGSDQLQDLYRRAALILQQKLRNSDSIVRTQGEFIIVLPETSHHSTNLVAQKILKALLTLEADLPVKFSLGFASYPHDTIEPDRLLNIARAALEKAQEDDSHRICSSVHLTDDLLQFPDESNSNKM